MKNVRFNVMKRFHGCLVFLLGLVMTTRPMAAEPILLGPPDPGAELGNIWFTGAYGEAYRFVDNTDPNSGEKDFALGNKTAGKENFVDWRSQNFPLGPAAGGAEPITFSFTYKLPGKVNRNDDIMVFIRFFDDSGTNFLGQRSVLLGSRSGDSEMTGYKTVTLTGIRALKNATGVRLPKDARTTTADIWVTCNIFEPWTSGDARFDDFSVTTLPGPSWISRHWLISLIALAALVLLPTLTIWAVRKRQGGQ